MNYRAAYEKGKGALTVAGIQEGELDARLLLELVCGTDRNTLLVHGDRELTADEEKRYLELIRKRSQRIPLQHLTGVQDFMGLEFRVNEHVLIPRQDTEILVEEVLQNLHDGMRILDMCTGSGCILISLMHYTNACTGVGADLSGEALQVARENAKRLSSEAVFVQSDLFENIEGMFDVIVSNPPYICNSVIETLMPEVRDHEPRAALDGGEDGLDFYREIIRKSKEHLMKGGMLFFEIGCDQGQAVSGLMEKNGFLEVQVRKDYADLDRVVYGTLGFALE
ncbi:MAG: peptide chain release factor N(5)-glutamine methyltransferase [Acetatifactor sp.]